MIKSYVALYLLLCSAPLAFAQNENENAYSEYELTIDEEADETNHISEPLPESEEEPTPEIRPKPSAKVATIAKTLRSLAASQRPTPSPNASAKPKAAVAPSH